MDPNQKMDPRVVAGVFAVCIVVGLAFVAMHGNPLGGLMWSGACLFTGSLGGFLFGIPKTSDDAKNPSSPALQKVNTNLEDISDWVTKIVVGLGLANLTKIPPRMQLAAGYISRTWNDTADQHAFAYAVMLYFAVVGFLAGYLLTRIFLSPMLLDAAGGDALRRLTSGGALTLSTPPVTGTGSSAASNPAVATGAVLTAYQALEKKVPASSLESHIKELETLKPEFPVFRMLYITLGRLYRATGDLDNGIQVLDEFIQNKEKAGGGGDADSGAAYYNRACYQVLKARAAVKESDKPELLEAALSGIKEAIKRASENKGYALEDADLTEIYEQIRQIT
jgi:hypothetical protein